MINSKRKGSLNELKVCKLLIEWTGFDFNRTPASGGLQWKNKSKVAGDIVCHNVDFVFCVEVKSRKKIFITNPMRKNSIVFKFWEQCRGDAVKVSRFPILFMRENGMPINSFYICVSIPVHLYHGLELITTGVTEDGVNLYVYKSTELLKLPYKSVTKLYQLVK